MLGGPDVPVVKPSTSTPSSAVTYSTLSREKCANSRRPEQRAFRLRVTSTVTCDSSDERAIRITLCGNHGNWLTMVFRWIEDSELACLERSRPLRSKRLPGVSSAPVEKLALSEEPIRLLSSGTTEFERRLLEAGASLLPSQDLHARVTRLLGLAIETDWERPTGTS